MRSSLVLIGCLALAACEPPPPTEVIVGPAAPDQALTAATPSGRGTLYECDTGTSLRAETSERRAEINLDDGRALDLPRISDAADRTYAADGWVWFENDTGAILTERGGQALCRRAA